VSKRNGLHTGSCVVHKVDGGVNRSVGWDWLVLLHSCIRCSSRCMLCEGMCVCVSASECVKAHIRVFEAGMRE
jgi:hypothetical protein